MFQWIKQIAVDILSNAHKLRSYFDWDRYSGQFGEQLESIQWISINLDFRTAAIFIIQATSHREDKRCHLRNQISFLRTKIVLEIQSLI